MKPLPFLNLFYPSLRPPPPPQLIITALNTWTESVLKETFFHADLHSGNILITPDGRVAFIDFGITGSISPKVKLAVASMTAAVATADYVEVARALTNMGATETEVDVEKVSFDEERKDGGTS